MIEKLKQKIKQLKKRKYKKLSAKDYQNQLKQNDLEDLKRLSQKGLWTEDFQAIVQINSTFVEFVDVDYTNKGADIVNQSLFLTFLLGVICLFFYQIIHLTSIGKLFPGAVILFFIMLPILVYLFWEILSIKDMICGLTRVPVRFNRKNKMVYVFQGSFDSKLISVPWDQLFFTYEKIRFFWYLKAYVLTEDRTSIVDEIVISEEVSQNQVFGRWAFLRAYMELDAVKAASNSVSFCLPMTDKEESLAFSAKFELGMFTKNFWYTYLFFLPLQLCNIFPRYYAMKYGQCPVWPEAIEAECQIDPDDPYQKTEKDNHIDAWWAMFVDIPSREYLWRFRRVFAGNKEIRAKILAKVEQELIKEKGELKEKLITHKSKKELNFERKMRKAKKQMCNYPCRHSI